tara:strand:+ start:2081 stop:2320 length:240 start_codon:yes stop_codon:yes gene_type:complete
MVKNWGVTLYEAIFARGSVDGIFEKATAKLRKVQAREQRREQATAESIAKKQARLQVHETEAKKAGRAIEGYRKLFEEE